MPFFQAPPALSNQYRADSLLRAYLTRHLPPDVRKSIEPALDDLGERAGGDLYASLLAGYKDEPTLVQWDAWGRRVDRIALTPHWQKAARVATEHGLVATAYERKHGEHSRLHQFAMVYLFDPSSGVYTCPLAMTDGAAKTLTTLGNARLVDRALPRLTSRDPAVTWTSGQWMTERTGGSDVAISECVARAIPGSSDFKLYGTKWFSSATTSQMALTLARPEGNPAGGSGLALFYVELRDGAGELNGIQVSRLKEKLGTRMLPTAELALEGALATPVRGLTDGVKNITPMLTITRTWNAVCSVASMRRGLALSRDYADRRVAFGAALAEKSLHVDTLAGLEAEYEAGFALTFRAVQLLGREEAGVITPAEARLLRVMTPLMKLTTGRQAVASASEVVEGFGGAGYCEDTGLARLTRDAQVFSIWEGTTNVLALDVFRALGREGSVEPVVTELTRLRESAKSPLAQTALDAVAHAGAWLKEAQGRGQPAVEAGARRFALTLGRALALALLVDHAEWAKRELGDGRPGAAARRFARHGVDGIADLDEAADSRALASDSPRAS